MRWRSVTERKEEDKLQSQVMGYGFTQVHGRKED